MLRDVKFFTAKLSKLGGFGDAGDYLSKIIMAKDIRSPTPPPAPTPTAAPAEETTAAKTADDAEAKPKEKADKAQNGEDAKE
jgi:vacuolar protein sorting-associated protein 54